MANNRDKIYKKLVRNKIPEIIINDGSKPITRVLSITEYKIELERKLSEEYNEVINADNPDDRIEELADMLEVMISLAKLENKTLEDIVQVASLKKNKRGGFDEKIFLEKNLNNKYYT